MRKAWLYRNTFKAKKVIEKVLRPADIEWRNGEWWVKFHDRYLLPYWEPAEVELSWHQKWRKLPDTEIEDDELKAIVLKELQKLRFADTDWSWAADRFVEWLLKHPSSESFSYFIDIFRDEGEKYLWDETWDFFFGYGDDCRRFAEDFVVEEEQENFLRYCESKKNFYL